MKPAEAGALLGVGPPVDPKILRRAYLRKVKTCKPEQDPEGFARLREAYELLKAGGGRAEPSPEPVRDPSPTPPEP